MQITHAPKIEGKWSGENWSNIDLHSAQEAGDGYAGSFEDAAGNRGAMKLEWSMLSGRFEGNWSVGLDRSGSIVLRRSELDSLRGAISLDPRTVPAKNETRLRDFHWKSAGTPSQEAHHEQLTLVAAPETGKIVRMLRNSVVPSVPTIHVFLVFADDEIPRDGPFGDPTATITLPSEGVGAYTVAVVNFLSGPDDGGDGRFDFTVQASGNLLAPAVPEPSSAIILSA